MVPARCCSDVREVDQAAFLALPAFDFALATFFWHAPAVKVAEAFQVCPGLHLRLYLTEASFFGAAFFTTFFFATAAFGAV